MIKFVLFDIDGVLTDGKLYFNEEGKEIKAINYKDLDSIVKLQENYTIGLITAENSKIADYFENKISPNFFKKNIKNKLVEIDEIKNTFGFDNSEICYVGDSYSDLNILKNVGLGICPQNAINEVKKHSDVVLEKNSGDGCLEELLDILSQDSMYGNGLNIRSFIKKHNTCMTLMSQDKEIIKTIERVCILMLNTFLTGNKLLMCGNGGSASDCQHVTTELVSKFLIKKRKAINAISLTVNTSTLTAIANDEDYSHIFSRQVEAIGDKGDLLIGISTSGQSLNVLEAFKEAKKQKINTVLLTGDNKDLKHADIVLNVPSKDTATIQELHIFIMHYICNFVERNLYERGEI